MDKDFEEVVLALGSNLGDRIAHLREGVGALGEVVEIAAVSPVVESRAENLPEGSDAPDFLNAAVRGRTRLDPEALLDACHSIEEASGRPRARRPTPGSRHRGERPAESRTLDVDLVFYGERKISEPALRVPHPRWKERGFVLHPLLAVAPEWRDPHTGETVEEVCRSRRHLLSAVRVVAAGETLR